MSLTVTTPADNFDLCTVEQVKGELKGIPEVDASTFDKQIGTWIRQASAAIAQFCNRTFAQQVYLETLGGFGSVYLQLHEAPILAVASILYQGAPITDYSIEDAQAGLLYRQQMWTWNSQVGWALGGYPLPRSEMVDAVGGFAVAYTAGWILPSQTPILDVGGGGLALPEDISKATVDLVKSFYFRRKVDPEIAERRVGGFAGVQVRYREGADANDPSMPRDVAWKLRPYVVSRL